MKRIPDFLENATNVYRTKNFIVKQILSIECDDIGNSRLYSYDTYYLRNKKLDKLFELAFKERDFVDGKRVHSTAYERKYM